MRLVLILSAFQIHCRTQSLTIQTHNSLGKKQRQIYLDVRGFKKLRIQKIEIGEVKE